LLLVMLPKPFQKSGRCFGFDLSRPKIGLQKKERNVNQC